MHLLQSGEPVDGIACGPATRARSPHISTRQLTGNLSVMPTLTTATSKSHQIRHAI